MTILKNNFKHIKFFVIIFVLACSFFLSFQMRYSHVIRRPDLLSLDPLYFSAQTKSYLKSGIATPSGWHYLVSDQGYPKGIVVATGLIQRSTQIPLNEIYRWLGPVLTSLFAVFFFLATRKTFGDFPALIGGWLYSFSPYILNRGLVTVPENLAVGIFFIIIYGLLQKKWWLVGVGFILMAAFHNSFLYFVPSLLLLPLLASWSWKKKIISLGVLLVLGGVSALIFRAHFEVGLSIGKQFLQSDIYFAWPKIDFLTNSLHSVLALLGIVGLVFILIAYLRKPNNVLAVILALAIPFTVILLFFHGQSKIDFGPILPERFFIYHGLILALSTAWLLQQLFKRYRKTHLEPVLFLAIFAILVYFQPTKITPWFWVFSPKEVQAAKWLDKNVPPGGKVLSQPLLGWLIRDETNQATLDSQMDVSVQYLIDISPGTGHRYVFISRTKNLPEYYTDFSDGTTHLVGYHGGYLPPINEALYVGLPKLYDNKEVAIYQLR